jgi:N-acetylmuramoyl-L-alanine amidase
VLLAALMLGACAPLTPRTELPLEQRPSPNFDARRPTFVILHHTGSDRAEHALATLTDPDREVSSHYLIARDGTLYYLVDELARAWHAGESYWGGSRDMNSASIGIELDNDGDEPYAEPQLRTLLALLADLQLRYGIPPANFLGHADVAPRRKTDPGANFPWRRLAAAGFGLWCEPPWVPAPAGIGRDVLLGALGYDVSDIDAATAAFKRHFRPGSGPGFTDEDRALSWCLLSAKTYSQGLAPSAPAAGMPAVN